MINMNQFASNADDLTASLSSHLAAINLNVEFQNSVAKKRAAASDIIPNVISNDILYLPLYTKDVSSIQEFIPKCKPNNYRNKVIFKKTNTSELSLKNGNQSPMSTFQDLAVALVPEFVPRRMSNSVYTKNFNKPEIVKSLNLDSDTAGNELINSSYTDSNMEAVATYQENVNGTVYFYTAPLTQSNITSPVDGLSASPTQITDPAEAPLISKSTVVPSDATARLTRSIISDLSAATPVCYIRNELPKKVGGNYCNIEPLESLPAISSSVLKRYVTSAYKASHVKTRVNYFMKRIHNVSLSNPKCNSLANNWKKLNHSGIVHLREMFATRDFGDTSVIFIYDYHEGSQTLLAKHFSAQSECFDDTFSSDPNAPRPYSHTKNALLRQQHNYNILPESELWSYVIQLTGALRVIHAAGLACRCLDPSKVIISNGNRVRLTSVGIFDVILYDQSPINRVQLTSLFQQEDLLELGKLLLALTCGTLTAIQSENLQTSLDVMSRTYSTDIRNLISYLLYANRHRSIIDLMPMIGARFYSQIDDIQLQCDTLESEIKKRSGYRKLLKLVIKLTCINEWPDLDQQWTDSSNRYMLSLFRNYMYRQMSEDLKPWININQIVHSLTKLRDGSPEKICLTSDGYEQSRLAISYDELKECFQRSFNELYEKAAYVTDDSNENVTDLEGHSSER